MKKLIIVLFFLINVSNVLLFCAEEGIASWYGGKFQGRQTASGEVFDTNKFTAAHKTLPFGTIVRVFNLENEKSTIVRINDRGPFIEGRIIDLSRAAAFELGMTGKGIARVRVEILETHKPHKTFSIQLGAYRDVDNAQRALKLLNKAGFEGVLEQSSTGINRLIIKNIDEGNLEQTKNKLFDAGFSSCVVFESPTNLFFLPVF